MDNWIINFMDFYDNKQREFSKYKKHVQNTQQGCVKSSKMSDCNFWHQLLPVLSTLYSRWALQIHSTIDRGNPVRVAHTKMIEAGSKRTAHWLRGQHTRHA